MKPLLTVFIDGIRPEAVKRMPFVREFQHRSRIYTELGYSVTCDASMYSGVRPNRHLNWFIWKKGDHPMYPWTKNISRHPGSNLMISAYAAYRLTKLFSHSNTSYYGVKYITGSAFRYWHEFEMVEKKAWAEGGALETYPTVFDLLKQQDIFFKTSGFRHFGGGQSTDIIGRDSFSTPNPWTYLFVGNIDGLSHSYGQDADVVTAKLLETDTVIKNVYKQVAKAWDQDPVFMLFSDHGMAPVDRTVDIKAHFRKHGLHLSDYCHMIDNNYARFWFTTDKQRVEVEKAVATLEPGWIITPDIAKQYHVDMPDNRFGDLVFYLDLPCSFGRAWYPLGISAKTKPWHHGYHPGHAVMDGALVASEPLRNDCEDRIELCDIMPSILQIVGAKTPDHLDGRSIWKLT